MMRSLIPQGIYSVLFDNILLNFFKLFCVVLFLLDMGIKLLNLLFACVFKLNF